MSPRPGRDAVGFTLVELLVVIGITGLLISILLPSLTRARAAANQAVCLSNVRQIALACCSYATDNRGAIVSAYSSASAGKDTVDGITGNATLAWNWESVQQQVSPYAAAYSFEGGLLGRYLKSDKVLECPALAAVDLPPAKPGQPANGYGIAVLANSKLKHLSQIESTSETALFGDVIMYGSSTTGPSAAASLSRTTYLNRPSDGAIMPAFQTFHGRHLNGFGVIGFYDGHAEPIDCQLLDARTSRAPASTLAALRALHIGSAMPGAIDYSQITAANYAAYCAQTYNFYFWANKNTRQ